MKGPHGFFCRHALSLLTARYLKAGMEEEFLQIFTLRVKKFYNIDEVEFGCSLYTCS